MNTAIIPAAGAGRRMGAGRAKQFLELDGEPILVHTLRQFDRTAEIDEIVVVLPADEIDAFLETARRAGIAKLARTVAGGAERQESVERGLEAADPDPDGVVAIHDGVRPFVTPEQIAAVVARAHACGAAILALSATDTVKEVDGGRIVRTLDRSRIALAQTPQAFRRGLLADAFARARREGWAVTDDASLVERAGHRVEVVEGSPFNIKITRPSDLEIARCIRRAMAGD